MPYLAAMSFADPLMLVGLLAALIPVALHLLNRIRAPVIPFPTLRFLRLTAQKTARRRQIQQYLLLMMRVLVFALVALAVAAPLIRGGTPSLAYGLVLLLLLGLALFVLAGATGAAAIDRRRSRQASPPPGSASGTPPSRASFGLSAILLLAALLLGGYSAFGLLSDRYFSGDRGAFSGRSTACAIIVDNSHSMLAKEDSASRLVHAREEVRELLGQTIRPAEAAIIPTNIAGSGRGVGGAAGTSAYEPMTTDMTRLIGYVDKLTPVRQARPMQECIRIALRTLDASAQPNKMLVIISDFARPAFADPDTFTGIKEISWRKDLQLILLPPASVLTGNGSGTDDVGITSLTIAEGSEQPVIGAQITFEAQIINNGDAANVRDLAFLVDGQPIDGLNPRVQLGAAGTASARTTVRIPYRLTQAGMHRFALALKDAPDAMAWDDQRELVLDVGDPVKVLVVGPEDIVRPRSAAFYFMAALAPYSGAATTPWSIKPTYRGLSQIRDASTLAGNTAVFMCDVPRVTPAQADALLRYVRNAGAGGGRLVWILGPTVDAKACNEILLAQNRDLLPAPLAEPIISATGSPIDWVEEQSDLFANLFDTLEPFHNVIITGRWTLAGAAGNAGGLDRGRTLAKLADGSPILTQHSPSGAAGSAAAPGGTVYTLLTSPAADWSNLGGTVLLVPMALRMALGGSHLHENISYETGTGLWIRIPALDANPTANAGISLDVTTPEKSVINVQAEVVGDALRWYFLPSTEGLYTWKSSDGRHAGMFAVNPPGDEADLLPADVPALAREAGQTTGEGAGGRQPIVAGSPEALLAQLQQRGEGTSLMPGFLALALILAVGEALLANRHRPALAAVPA